MNLNKKKVEKKEPAIDRFLREYTSEGTTMLVKNTFVTEKGTYDIRIFKNKDGMIFFAKFKDGNFCEFTNLTTFGGIYTC